jgi:hypothetical protein
MEPSLEQMIIIEHIKEGKNVIVDACAGSGKSTTILSCAKQMPNHNFLQLTYNSMLRMEIAEKIKEYGLKNIVVHTYHSLAVSKYTKSAKTDSGIREILFENMSPNSPIKPQDIIVLDETQDMTYLYFQFIVKFSRDMGSTFQLLILGDYMQGLYEFKGADIRFLTMANSIWASFSLLKSREFENCSLKTSYRITNQMADFINEVMLGEERIHACKDGPPVTYIRNTADALQRIASFHIIELIKSGVKPDEIFILGGSVKGVNSQIRRIENALVEAGIPCHVPMLETDTIDEKVIVGKVVFSTFHSVKGRQRGYVFIVGFDQSYFRNYARTITHDECPNTLYVGGTRAMKQLFLLERGDDCPTARPLHFLRLSHNEMKTKPYIRFKGLARTVFYDKEEKEGDEITTHNVTPTDLIKFIAESVLEEISPLLDKMFLRESEENLEILEIPTIIQTTRGFYEDVSDINGIAIPSIYYDYLREQWTDDEDDEDESNNILYDMIRDTMSSTKSHEYRYLKGILETIDKEITSVSDYLYLSNVYLATQEKLYYKLRQIERNEYNWLKPDILSKCKRRLLDVLEKECGQSKPVIEESIIHQTNEESHINIDRILEKHFPRERFRFTARIDLGTENTIWELKCTTSITQDHLLQVVIYCWIWRTVYPDAEQEFRIFNIKSGEILRLDANKEMLDHIILLLLNGKYGKEMAKEDTDFLRDCTSIIS